MTEIEITDEDREAAWPCRPWHMTDTVATCSAWNEGEYDHLKVIQAFARHRIAARNRALEDVERACRAAQYSPAPYTDTMAAIRSMRGE